MARTKSRSTSGSKNSKKKGPKVIITKRAEDRNVGSGKLYIRLGDDDKFTGFALFDPDPAAEDNPGYVEYGEHWDQKNGRFVPCWGEKNGCIYCRSGMQPSQRALAAFLVTSINGEELEESEIKLFRMNWTVIQEWGDTLDEDGSTLGQKIRIKCTSKSDGEFITKFYEKDRLSKKDIKAAIKDIPDIEELLQKNLNRALEALAVEDVLESDDDEDEDDDDEEEETTKSKSKSKSKPKSKSKKRAADDDDDEDEDDDEEEEDDEDEESDDDEEEDDDEESEDDSDDDDESDDEDEEDESDDEESDDDDEESDDDEDDEETEDDEDEKLEGEFTVASASESEMTFTLKELDNDVYIGKDIANDVDFDEFKKGDKVRIVAEQDEDGDFVATEISKLKAKGNKSKTKGKGKGSKKKK